MKATIAINHIKGYELRVVEAHKTCSPHFVINRPVVEAKNGKKQGWNVTHVKSGLSAARGVSTLKVARLVAGALSGLPIPWARVTRNTKYGPDYLRRKIGMELALWYHSISRGI